MARFLFEESQTKHTHPGSANNQKAFSTRLCCDIKWAKCHNPWSCFPSALPAHESKLTTNEPAEEEEGYQRVPGCAESAERVGRAVFGFLSAWEAGEHRQHQAEGSQHDQIDGDEVLPRTVIQMYCTCWTHTGGWQRCVVSHNIQEINHPQVQTVGDISNVIKMPVNVHHSLTHRLQSQQWAWHKEPASRWLRRERIYYDDGTNVIRAKSNNDRGACDSPSAGVGSWGALRICRTSLVFDIMKEDSNLDRKMKSWDRSVQ